MQENGEDVIDRGYGVDSGSASINNQERNVRERRVRIWEGKKIEG